MQIHDETRNPRPSPVKAPPVAFGPPLPPDAPRLPWRIEARPYGGHSGTAVRTLPTKIYADGRVGDLLIPCSDEARLWAYIAWLENENARLRVAAELAPLDSPLVPPAVAAVLTDPTDPAPSLPFPSDPPRADNANAEPQAAEAVADKRVRTARELLADPSASNGLIAERAECSDELARRVRAELIAEGKLPPVAAVKKRGGGTYSIGNAADSTEEQPAAIANGDGATGSN